MCECDINPHARLWSHSEKVLSVNGWNVGGDDGMELTWSERCGIMKIRCVSTCLSMCVLLFQPMVDVLGGSTVSWKTVGIVLTVSVTVVCWCVRNDDECHWLMFNHYYYSLLWWGICGCTRVCEWHDEFPIWNAHSGKNESLTYSLSFILVTATQCLFKLGSIHVDLMENMRIDVILHWCWCVSVTSTRMHGYGVIVRKC